MSIAQISSLMMVESYSLVWATKFTCRKSLSFAVCSASNGKHEQEPGNKPTHSLLNAW